MTETIWQVETLSGVPVMDTLQRDFCNALRQLASANDQEFGTKYKTFVEKLEHIFLAEEDLMEKIEFPAFRAHQEQHARVLGSLHNIHGRIMSGELDLGREVALKLLPKWFSFHSATMDAALSIALQMAEAEFSKFALTPPMLNSGTKLESLIL